MLFFHAITVVRDVGESEIDARKFDDSRAET